MTNLIIDAANEKIIFVIITDKQLYTTSYLNSRENFDNFMKLLLTFIHKKKKRINYINKIFVKLGPVNLQFKNFIIDSKSYIFRQ